MWLDLRWQSPRASRVAPPGTYTRDSDFVRPPDTRQCARARGTAGEKRYSPSINGASAQQLCQDASRFPGPMALPSVTLPTYLRVHVCMYRRSAVRYLLPPTHVARRPGTQSTLSTTRPKENLKMIAPTPKLNRSILRPPTTTTARSGLPRLVVTLVTATTPSGLVRCASASSAFSARAPTLRSSSLSHAGRRQDMPLHLDLKVPLLVRPILRAAPPLCV